MDIPKLDGNVSVHIDSDCLQIVLGSQVKPYELVDELEKKIGSVKRIRGLDHIYFMSSIFIILLVMGTLDTFGNSVHSVLSSVVETSIENQVASGMLAQLFILVGSVFIFTTLLVLVRTFNIPSVTDNPTDATLKIGDWIKAIFNSREKTISRIAKIISRNKSFATIEIWNPLLNNFNGNLAEHANGSLQCFIHYLLPAIDDQTVTTRIRLYGKDDDIAKNQAKIRRLTKNKGINIEFEPFQFSGGNTVFLGMLDQIELRLIPYFFISIYRDNQNLSIFSEKYFLKLVESQLQDIIGIRVKANVFIRSCKKNYGLLNEHEKNQWTLTKQDVIKCYPEISNEVENLRSYVYEQNLANSTGYCDPTDPSSFLAAIHSLIGKGTDEIDADIEEHCNQNVNDLLELYVNSVEQTEINAHFPPPEAYMKRTSLYLHEKGYEVLSRLSFEADIVKNLRTNIEEITVFNYLSLDAIKTLARLHESTGNYKDSLVALNKVSNFCSPDVEARKIRIRERQGALDNHINDLDSIATLIKEVNSGYTNNDGEVALKLEAAWIIYNYREIQSDSAKYTRLQGWEYLEECEKKMRHSNETSTFTWWRIYNYMGLYEEWGGMYDDAIAYHMKALGVPGVDLKWYSGSLVNLGYTSRKNALFKYRELGKKDEALTDLKKSVIYCLLAIDLKRSIKDEDELPVSYHNAAISLICFAYLNDPKDVNGEYEVALELIESALDILNKKDSQKKKMALFLEKFIAMSFINMDTMSIKVDLYKLAEFSRDNDAKTIQNLSEQELEPTLVMKHILDSRLLG